MNLLVTGGAGFIGSNFIRHWLNKHSNDSIVNYDALTYAGCKASLNDVRRQYSERYFFVQGDIRDYDTLRSNLKKYSIDTVVNFAAESHNSRSVLNPGLFVDTNVVGTQRLLEASRDAKITRLHHISTCEVFGDLALDSKDKFKEDSPYRPRTPYNASKASADMICRAYTETFEMPITISNCSNNYGPFQFPEKIIPLFTIKALKGDKMPLYKSSKNKREWIHVLDHCRGIEKVILQGVIGETYNIGTEFEADIETIADTIVNYLGMDSSVKKYVSDRPGHDRRYLLDSSKIREQLGWKPEIDFEIGIAETIEWYKQNKDWWEPLLNKITIKEDKWK